MIATPTAVTLQCGMRRALTIHPDSRCAAVARIEVELTLPRPGHLLLEYIVTGKLGDLRLPPVTTSARADELWQHTCFEAFVQAPPAAGYCEFNFSPSTQWAAYRFTGYRAGMRVASDIAPPRLSLQSDPGGLRLQAAIDLAGMADLSPPARWRLGLSAVIEEADGRKSYWALAHPPGNPDFHHAGGFAVELQPAGAT